MNCRLSEETIGRAICTLWSFKNVEVAVARYEYADARDIWKGDESECAPQPLHLI